MDRPDNWSTRVNFQHGQKGNQFPTIDGELSLLGLWRWWSIATCHFGALRVAGFLIGLKFCESNLSSLIRFFRAAHSASQSPDRRARLAEHKNRLAYTDRNRDYGINDRRIPRIRSCKKLRPLLMLDRAVLRPVRDHVGPAAGRSSRSPERYLSSPEA